MLCNCRWPRRRHPSDAAEGGDETTPARSVPAAHHLPQVSGVRFAFDPSRPPGARVVPGSVRVSGAPLDPARRYKGARPRRMGRGSRGAGWQGSGGGGTRSGGGCLGLRPANEPRPSSLDFNGVRRGAVVGAAWAIRQLTRPTPLPCTL